MTTVAILRWTVRNANDYEGAWAFTTPELARQQVREWLESCDLTKAEVTRRMRELKTQGTCEGPKSEDYYHVEEVLIFTMVQR